MVLERVSEIRPESRSVIRGVMARSSIDVIEDVLGDNLFPAGWTARSFAEIDLSDAAYRIPDISLVQYQHIQAQLQAHWAAAIRTLQADRGTLFVCSNILSRLHQYLALLELDPVERLERSKGAWRLQVKPQIGLDEAVIARQALLYSETVVIRDPAEVLRPLEHDTPQVLQPWWDTKSDAEGAWRELWRSAFCGLGVVQ
jgi:hypothetical protein